MKLIFFILLQLIATNLRAQQADTLQKFKAKFLSGYFVFVRDSIPQTPLDVYLPRQQYDIFFLQNIDSNIIYHLENPRFPSKDSAIFVSGSLESLIDKWDRSKYSKWLTQNGMDNYNSSYRPFDTKRFPKELVESRHRFISVYKGNVEVIGPFLTSTRHNIIKQKVYLYFPSNTSKTEYLFTVFFPPH